MENKAHYALIGAFVIIAALAVVAFAAWLSNAQFDQQFDDYEVVFSGPVRGLSKGSEVRYNGLRVGEVTRLRWDEEDSNTIIAKIQVVENTPVHVDSQAQLEPQGLTGLNYIQITSGASGEAFRGRGPHQIPGLMSQLDTFLDGGGSVIEGAQRALGRFNGTLSPEAVADFHAILSNINTITGNFTEFELDPRQLERTLLAYEQAAKDISKAALAIDASAGEFDGLVNNEVKSLLKRSETSLAEVDKMLASITQFANGGEALTTDARDAINRLSNSGLTDLEETADGIRRLIGTLNEIAEKLEASPTQFIVGEEREVMELPQ